MTAGHDDDRRPPSVKLWKVGKGEDEEDMTLQEIDALNTAAKAMNLGLAGMTWDRWQRLSEVEKTRLRSNAGLSPQLIGLEGYRVEVIDGLGQTRRFWVSRSSGWLPCHIELKLRTSRGGVCADRTYVKVTPIGRKRLMSLA